MSSEEGGSWFFLVIENSYIKGVVLDSEQASTENVSNLMCKLKEEGINPVFDDKGAWKALSFEEDFSPYTVPESIKILAQYIKPGTVITLDNGCFPSVEWRFRNEGIEVFDTYDYVSE